MKKKNVLLIGFILLASIVCAAGKTEEAQVAAINNDWILCVTALDSSSLAENQRTVVDVFMRGLVDKIRTIQYRLRVSHEYAYYEDYAWSRDLATAAKALEAAQNRRTALLYQGDPDWKYRQNIKKSDTEIAKLKEAYDKKEAERPHVNQTPNFDITAGNKDRNFPAPPTSGGEYRFCQTQRADGFLSGTVTVFYGRYYVTLKLYTQYTRSYIYEDSIIFSAEDIDGAVDEIAEKLLMVLAGNKPAAIAIRVEPPETLVLINQGFGGWGSAEARELPPGKVAVALSADGYNSEIIEAELSSGELTEISVSLGIQLKGDVEITVPGASGASVYQGALYVGEAPLTLRLPLNQLDYVNVLAPRGEEGRAVFYTPENYNQGLTFSLKTKVFPSPGERRVDKARRRYYWAWGGTWIAGMAAWIISGISTGYSNGGIEPQATQMNYVTLGAVGLTGAVALYMFFEEYRYLNTATKNVTPIVKTEIKK
jgi:hypothetical protein